MTYPFQDPFQPLTLDVQSMSPGDTAAVGVMNEFLTAIGAQVPLVMERWPYGLDRPTVVYFLTFTDVMNPCFGKTVIESLSLVASYIMAFTLKGAIVSTVWKQRLIDAGLQIISREEIMRGYKCK